MAIADQHNQASFIVLQQLTQKSRPPRCQSMCGGRKLLGHGLSTEEGAMHGGVVGKVRGLAGETNQGLGRDQTMEFS